MSEGVAWVFNLDAEDELKRDGGRHAPRKETRALALELMPTLSRLLGPDDQVLWPEAQPITAQWGRPWCPTPWALECVQRAGLRVPPVPAFSVVQRVNHRQFCAELGDSLEGAHFVTDRSALMALIQEATVLNRVSVERNWLLKLPLSYAGRGRRKIAAGPLNAKDVEWVDAAFRSGVGVQLEPVVQRELDVALHGWLARDGSLTRGVPTRSTIDASGRWVETTRAEMGALSADETLQLTHTLEQTGRALHAAGYFGPFGIDAFRWRDPAGAVHFRPRCEINARYSMGWAVGLEGFRPAPGLY